MSEESFIAYGGEAPIDYTNNQSLTEYVIKSFLKNGKATAIVSFRENSS